MKTFEERIAWIKENRPSLGSDHAISLAAKLGKGTVNALIRRERKNGSASLDHASCVAIATVANVDLYWFMTGEGAPDGEPPRSEASAETIDLYREAADMLHEIDGLPRDDAWIAVRDIHLEKPTVRGIYKATRLKLDAEAGKPIAGERVLKREKKKRG